MSVAHINWYSLPGGKGIDLQASYDALWAINLDRDRYLMHCKLPCDKRNNSWNAILGVSKVKSFAVNPFEIWVISQANKLFRCQLPCKSAGEFQLVSAGISQVALGLDQVWTVDVGNKVGRVKFDFSRAKKHMDFKKLKWTSLEGKMKSISIAEDGDVWGVRKDDSRLVRYHPPIHKWLITDNIKAERVSVGVDYIYIVGKSGATRRCQRPCWKIKFDHLDRKICSVHAEYCGSGLFYGTTMGYKKKGNLIVGFS